MQGNLIEDNVPGGAKSIVATQSPTFIVFDADPVHFEQTVMQKVIAFFRHLFTVLANGFVGW